MGESGGEWGKSGGEWGRESGGREWGGERVRGRVGEREWGVVWGRVGRESEGERE